MLEIIKNESTWYEANRYCKSHQKHLVRVKDDKEDGELKDALNDPQSLGSVWLGLHLNWIWSDNSSYFYKHWSSQEPKDEGGKRCVAAHMDNEGKWEDLNCDQKLPFMCYKGEVHFYLHTMNQSNINALQ